MAVGANHLLLTDTLVHEFEIFRLQTISTRGQECPAGKWGTNPAGLPHRISRFWRCPGSADRKRLSKDAKSSEQMRPVWPFCCAFRA